MTSMIIALLKSLLVEKVIKAAASAAIRSGIKMARIGAQASTNKLDDAVVDGLEDMGKVVLDVWNEK